MRRALIQTCCALTLGLAALTGCGQTQPSAEGPPAAAPAPAQASAGGEDEVDRVLLGSTQNLPDWLFILRTSDGGTIHFNQRAITREGGFADIWLQVRHGQPQLYAFETETTETAVRYEVERLHYRFNCAEEAFLIVERQIMGANEEVVGRDEPRQIWRPVTSAGAAPHIMPIACRGA